MAQPPTDRQIAWATGIISALAANPEMGRFISEGTAKRLATIITRQYDTKRPAALNMVAVYCGFANWIDAQPVFVSNNSRAANRAKYEKQIARRLRRTGKWVGTGDLRLRVIRRLTLIDNLSDATLVHGRGQRRRLRIAFDRSGVAAPGWDRLGTSMSALTPGDAPVDRVAVRVVFGRDPKLSD